MSKRVRDDSAIKPTTTNTLTVLEELEEFGRGRQQVCYTHKSAEASESEIHFTHST